MVASTGVGYKFAGWTVSGGTAGTCEGTTSPCTLLTDANKTVEAKFE
ncbi:MAG: InlB B-repeat-containing protein [Solirubrobacterales bacterium]